MQPDSKSLKYLTDISNVSRETLERLQKYVDLTIEWQKAINLVSLASLGDIWWRHIVDSAQLEKAIPIGTQTILDIGSGGGFPALVLAALYEDRIAFTLVESDRRKGIFMREATRVMGLKQVEIITARIEDMPARGFDLVTARALASVQQLLEWSLPFSNAFLFPKGEQAGAEIDSLDQDRYNVKQIQSVTDEKAVILQIDSL